VNEHDFFERRWDASERNVIAVLKIGLIIEGFIKIDFYGMIDTTKWSIK